MKLDIKCEFYIAIGYEQKDHASETTKQQCNIVENSISKIMDK